MRCGTPAPPTSVRKPWRDMMASSWLSASRGNSAQTQLQTQKHNLPTDVDPLSLCFHSNRLYSGSADCTIIVSRPSVLLLYCDVSAWAEGGGVSVCLRCGTSRLCRKSTPSAPTTTPCARWSPPTTCCSAAPSKPSRYC